MLDKSKVNWKKIGEALRSTMDSDDLCEAMEEELEKQGLDSHPLFGCEGTDWDVLEAEIGRKITAAFKE